MNETSIGSWKVVYSRVFERKLKKSHELKELVAEKTIILQGNPFDPSLKTHKLQGKWSDYWSFSINYSQRIMFKFLDSTTIGFIDLGGHEIYK